ncbi:MAG TPA: GntG family PLP-dependent aldolase, partial [Gemmatimonadaceae bacterium]|nr:GntG family PLP-dependent aldolase [Gemmatimonadaceae bacterium]
MSIDLRSDTVTKPTPGMRAAMAAAEVGDDERDGDPTTRRLEQRVAQLLGKEDALFFPSGVMANQAGIWVHAERGTEVLLDADAHIVHSEIAATAVLSGAQVLTVVPTDLVMSAADLRAAFRPKSRYYPAASLVCVENTHNGAGGVITPIDELRAIREVAAEQGVPVHMDGARLWNASVASGVPLPEIASHADTVMVAFSKGLGAPVGAALVGSASHMEKAWTARKLFGGAMRQSGILAAAVLYGLDHHLGRLAEDHANARLLAETVDGAGGARVVPPDTNIVMIDLSSPVAGAVAARAREREILVSEWSPTRIRLVTHLDVSPD